MRYITVHGYQTPNHPTLINVDDISVVRPGYGTTHTRKELTMMLSEEISKKLDEFERHLDSCGNIAHRGVDIQAKRNEAAEEVATLVEQQMKVLVYIKLHNDQEIGVIESMDRIVEKLDEVQADEGKEDFI